jgi:hypothetical protein
MSYVHITGDKKNPARTKKLTTLFTSGILQASGANINPMAHPVKDIKTSQKGTRKRCRDIGRL